VTPEQNAGTGRYDARSEAIGEAEEWSGVAELRTTFQLRENLLRVLGK
jgi:hypothetical protein